MKKIITILLILVALIGIEFLLINLHLYLKKTNDLKIVPLSARANYLDTKQSLAAVAAPHIEKMIQDAEKEGICLIVTSGYRTRERQQEIYDLAEDKSIVAIPGTSEHEKGLAVDLGGCPMIDGIRNDAGVRLELKNDFETLPEYQWLKQNTSKYGFKQSFPSESWHWKYIYY